MLRIKVNITPPASPVLSIRTFVRLYLALLRQNRPSDHKVAILIRHYHANNKQAVHSPTVSVIVLARKNLNKLRAMCRVLLLFVVPFMIGQG